MRISWISDRLHRYWRWSSSMSFWAYVTAIEPMWGVDELCEKIVSKKRLVVSTWSVWNDENGLDPPSVRLSQ